MRILRTSALIALIMVAASASAVFAESPSDTANIKAMERNIAPEVIVPGARTSPGSLAARMAFYKTPGVSIAFVHAGQIAWARGYGVSDPAQTPVTVDTLFQAASISKPVTALAVLRLMQAGKLDLDVDVNRYLKSWKVPPTDDGKAITLRELLSHTAGLTLHGFRGYAQGQPIPTLPQVLDGEKPANTPAIARFAPPGTVWRYSGGGYVIIQQLLQDVTGQAFPDLMQSLVLRPIGMTHSTFSQPLPIALKSAAATPYGSDGRPLPDGALVYPEMAPAGLWTTPSDLARYVIAVQDALAGKSSRIISQATAREYLKEVLGGWGLGLGVGGTSEHRWFGHSGTNDGFQSQLFAYDSGDGVVVMSNSDGGDGVMQDMMRTVAEDYHWSEFAPRTRTPLAAAPKTTDSYVGAYEITRFNSLVVSRKGDMLVLKEQQGGPPQHFLPESDSVWFSKDSGQRVSFDVTPDGQVADIALPVGGRRQKLKRLSDAEFSARTAELAERVKAQAPDARAEGALKELIGSLRAGRPDYDRLGERQREVTRDQLPDLQGDFRSLGDLQALTFKGVGPGGGDIYEAKFANGNRTFRVALDPQGRIDALDILAG
jgi:CubicO group peptidase (beta-lactamase class C family)